MTAARRWPVLPIIFLLAAPLDAQEARYVRDGRHMVRELSGVIPAAPRIRVACDVGSVSIDTAPGAEVRYRIRVRVAAADDAEARRRLDGLSISASKSGDQILFQGQAARPNGGEGLSAEFSLVVPSGTRQIEVASGAGDLEVRGIDGGATLRTRGGAITADRLGGPLRAETRGGDIDIGEVRREAILITAGGRVRLRAAGGAVTAQTSGGDVTIGRAGGEVRAETGGGNIALESSAGGVVAGTSGGNIDLGRVGGRVQAATSGGSIRVAASSGGVRCETAAGPIELKSAGGAIRALTSAGSIRADIVAAAGAFGESNLEAWQGDVTVVLPESMPLTIRALIDGAGGHRIQSDFPLTITRDTESAGRPMEIGEGRIGGGGSLLKLRTLGGNIVILKAGRSNSS